jgi:hypothetical protein
MRKTKKSIYTAIVPRTLRASRKVGTNITKKVNSFFRNTTLKLKRATKMINSRAAKSIHSLTKRRVRK